MPTRSPIARRLRALLAAVALIAGFATLIYLASEVVRQLQSLNSATSDNTQWTLSQAEVEYLKMLAAIEHAQAQDTGLDEVRRSVNIFFSRIDTIASSSQFTGFRDDPEAAAALDSSRSFLATAVPLVDGPDAALRAALPQLADQAGALRPALRRLALSGLEYFAAEGDARRESIKQTLVWLAVATAALLSLLMVLAARMARLYRLSERRAAELRETGVRLASIIDTSLEGVLVTDAHGGIVEFNPAAERIFGHRRADILGRNVAEVLVPERHREAHARDMAEVRRQGRVPAGAERRVLQAVRADGEVIPVEVAVQAVEGDDKMMLVGSVRDISGRLAAEREMVAARDRALAGERAKAAFVAQMSHEIRTPLNGLLGTLALLRDTALSPRQDRYVRTMETSGRILLGHVSDVLDVSRFEAGWPARSHAPTDLAAVVEEVLDNQSALARAAGNRLCWHWVGRPVPAVLTDAHRIRQIVMNLVGNAVKFTHDGEVSVTLEAVARDADTATVEISVSDEGIGISDDDLERVFHDFESGHEAAAAGAPGTGLGLGIVRRIVDAMGGTVAAHSVPGDGSVFRVRLPFALADGPAPAAARPLAEPAAPRQAVLVVEDNPVNRDVVREMLEADGHEVAEAADGHAGVAAAAARRFDLIFMDIAMPGMDGRAAARAIRGLSGGSRDAPIVALTAHDPPSDPAEWRSEGIDGWLRKPLDRGLLRRVLAGKPPLHGACDEPDPTNHAVLDRRRLEALGEELGTAVRDRLLRRFLADGEASLARIRGLAADGGQGPQIRAELHRLSGSAAMFGAVGLETVLRTRLAAPLDGDAAPDTPLTEDLQAAWSRLSAQLVPLTRAVPDREAG